MPNLTISQPHDGFFKNVLSNVEVAKDLLQAYLKPAITQRIKWDTLRLANKSFTDERLAQLHSDVVYACQIDEKGNYIYILVEQQTTPDPLLPFRFLQYNVLLLAEYIKQQKEHKKKAIQLPNILNLCIYTGKQTPYPYSVDIYDCFADPQLAKEQLCTSLTLIDLGQMSEAALKQHGTADLLELLLKQSHARTFLHWVKAHGEEMRTFFNRCYTVSGLHYMLHNEQKYSSQQLLDAIIAVVPHKEKDIMTAAQQLGRAYEQKGRREGIQKGRQEGETIGIQRRNQEIARNMLYFNEPKEKIHQFTGLSWVEIEALIREGAKKKQ